MSKFKPDHAFILAAGKGTRLRPHTNNCPKPLIEVNGRPILDYILDKLIRTGVTHVTINSNYLGDRIKNYIDNYEALNITHSPENKDLETGGGVKHGLHTMGPHPFYLINGDALWSDNEDLDILETMAQMWNPNLMDILLLLQPLTGMTVTQGSGDYDLKPNSQAVRSLDKTGTHMFGGIRICKPEIFQDSPDGAFSFLDLMDKAEKQGKLYAIEHKGEWHHISTPEDLKRVDKHMREIGLGENKKTLVS